MDILLNPIVSMAISLGILVYSAILHEIAHGYVADRLGDPTARLLGRLTLDPRPHIDPLLSIILPVLLILSGSPIIFGGAKPVPIDPFNLKEGRKDVALVSLAGPLTNVVLAGIAAIFLHLFFGGGNLSLISVQSPIAHILGTIVRINILLAIFNMIPLPPLDGSKVFALLLPAKAAATYLSLGSMGAGLVLLLLLLPTGFQNLISLIYHFFLSLLGF